MKENILAAFVAFVVYFFLAFLWKGTLSRALLGAPSLNGKKLINFLFLNFQLFFVSPDFVLSSLMKDIIWQTKDEKRSQIVWCFNLENIVLSLTTVVLFGGLAHVGLYDSNIFFQRLVLTFLGFRAISRSIEISISFVNDVCSSEHSSKLNWQNRVTLAFLSILEIVILSFGVNYCAGSSHNLSEAAVEAIRLIQSSSDEGFGGVQIVRTFSALSCFSLVGIVIGSYISGKKTIKVKAVEDAPLLFVVDDNGMRNAIPFAEGEKDGCWSLILINKVGCSYVVNDRGIYYHLSSKEYSTMPYVERAEIQENFILKGEVFEIDFNENTKEIKIVKKEETK